MTRSSAPLASASTRRGGAFAMAAIATTLGLAACDTDEPQAELVSEGAMVVETEGGPELVEWLVFEDSHSSLADAERHLLEMDSRAAGESLTRAADHFAHIAERATGDDARHLRASEEEMRALARDFPSDLVTHRRVLGNVEGRAFVALARHHLLAVERQVAEGHGVEAGRHLLTAINDVADGFRVAGVEMNSATEASLETARGVAEEWLVSAPATVDASNAVRQSVREEYERLANALGARRK